MYTYVISRAVKIVRQKLTNLSRDVDKFIITAGYFNIALSVLHETTGPRISKSIDLNTINQLDLIFIEHIPPLQTINYIEVFTDDSPNITT